MQRAAVKLKAPRRTASSAKSSGERPVEKTRSESAAKREVQRRLKARSEACSTSAWSTCERAAQSVSGRVAAGGRRRRAARRGGAGRAASAAPAHHRPVEVGDEQEAALGARKDGFEGRRHG